MLLSALTTDPDRFQFRDTKFSQATVDAIMAEGVVLAKFDALPVFSTSSAKRKPAVQYCIAGDGHSRLEAIRRLAQENRLPAAWKVRRDWDIPCRIVDEGEARRLAWTANLSRDSFTAAEEARVFQSMLDSGLSVEEVAQACQKSPTYVRGSLPLNSLCHEIKLATGLSPAAGGIDKLTAQVLASGFQKYGVEPCQQRDLWHQCLKHAMLNFQSAKRFIDLIGGQLSKRESQGMLFSMPANAAAVLEQAKARVAAYRRARTGIGMLMSALEFGGLEHLSDLADWVKTNGTAACKDLSARLTEDGEILASFIQPS